jgi:hypothetical protein
LGRRHSKEKGKEAGVRVAGYRLLLSFVILVRHDGEAFDSGEGQ